MRKGVGTGKAIGSAREVEVSMEDYSPAKGLVTEGR